MSGGGVNVYSSSNSQNGQPFNPYASYTSSNTFYDPVFNPPAAKSQQSSIRPKSNELFRAESPYPPNALYSHSSQEGIQPVRSYVSSKGSYAPGGYAEGPPRSPSPTPSELEKAKRGVIDWKTLFNWRTYAKKKYIPWIIALIICLVVVALMTLYHKEIVHWLMPAATWMHNLPAGWVIPIAVMFVISFPPLFGHEIVSVLCGLVWGLWIGFGIVAAGTLLGEIGNYYAFKYCCSARGEKLEKKKLSYACLARVVREGGFKIALVARLSAIPGHFTTAVFSTCGMGIVVFTIAAILSMPKQFITVYLGVILEQSDDTPEQKAANKKNRIISDVVLIITILVTIAAGWYMWREMERVKPIVMKERRREKRRLAAPQPETQYLGRPSEADLTSEENVRPVQPNEPRLGVYGYTGFAHSDISYDTLNAPTPGREDSYGNESYSMQETKAMPYAYSSPSGLRHSPYTVQPFASEEDTSTYHTQVPTDPPQIREVSNLTGPRRAGREGFELSEGASTVGMGSWGGLLKEESHIHSQKPSYAFSTRASMRPNEPSPHALGSPTTPRTSVFQTQHETPRKDGADEYGMLNRPAGLSAFGAPLGGGQTVSVMPRNAPISRTSTEVPNVIVGRSMRATIESSYDSDLEQTQYSPHLHPYDPSTASSFSQGPHRPFASDPSGVSGSYHTAPGTDMSQGTFGGGRTLHSREFASTGSSEIEESQMPGSYRT